MKLMTVYEYAKKIGKSRQEVYRLIRENRIPAQKITKQVVRIMVETEE